MGVGERDLGFAVGGGGGFSMESFLTTTTGAAELFLTFPAGSGGILATGLETGSSSTCILFASTAASPSSFCCEEDLASDTGTVWSDALTSAPTSSVVADFSVVLLAGLGAGGLLIGGGRLLSFSAAGLVIGSHVIGCLSSLNEVSSSLCHGDLNTG